MILFKDGFTIYKYGKEVLVYICVAAVLTLGVGLAYRSYHNLKMEKEQALFTIKELTVKNQDLGNQLHQAQNNAPLNQDDLKKTLSEQFQEQLNKQKQEVLAVVKQQIVIAGLHGGGGGTYDPTNRVYTYPKPGVKDPVMAYIHLDTKDLVNPSFDYKLNPQTITIEGTLNFDKKEGVPRYWTRPVITTSGGLEVTTSDAQFTPSKEFNAYLASLSTGHTEQVAVPAKWSVSAMVGREVAKEFPGGIRTVYGADITRNFSSIGIGGGVLGSTIYLKGVYNFGK